MLGKLLLGSPEDLCFCGFFGVSAEVEVEAWQMMEDHNCLPQTPSYSIICGRLHLCEHTLQTMKPFQDHLGGVTRRQFTSTCGHLLIRFLNWMKFWKVDYCVSLFGWTTTHLSLFTATIGCIKTGKRETSETTVFCWWVAQTSALWWAIQSLFMTRHSRGAGTAMVGLCIKTGNICW